jgi:hypothetical protein
MADRLQPGLEYFDVESVMPRTGVFTPDFGHGKGNPIIVSLHAGVPAEALLLVVDRWLDKPFDDTRLATKIQRHPVVTEREALHNPDLLARPKNGGLSERGNDAAVS